MKVKKSKKASKKSTDRKPRQGRLYTFSGKNIKADELNPQEKIVHAALAKRSGPASASDLASSVEAKLKADGYEQPAIRVVGFYLSKWKSDGLVKVVKAEKPKARAAKATAIAA